MQKIKNTFKNNKILYLLTKNLYLILINIGLITKRLLYFPFLLVPLNNKKIVITSYYGAGFGDSGRSIVEYIKKINKIENFEIYWAIENAEGSNLPSYIKPVKYNSLLYYYHLSTAKIWIDNSRKTVYPLFKRKNQRYIQTWHGGISLKKIEKDAKEKLSWHYILHAKKDSKMIDYFVSNSNFQTELIKSSFWYDGLIAEIGTPRVDSLILANTTTDLRKRLNIKDDKKIILYAPTFRNKYNPGVFIEKYNDILKIDKNMLILLKLHPNDRNSKKNILNERVIDVTDYPDIYELMKISDFLVTDYSSSMFEFSFTGKPVFLYINDYENYKVERGTYFNIQTLPFPIIDNEIDLGKSIKNFNDSEYKNKLKLFLEGIGLKEKGTASIRVYDYINEYTK